MDIASFLRSELIFSVGPRELMEKPQEEKDARVSGRGFGREAIIEVNLG